MSAAIYLSKIDGAEIKVVHAVEDENFMDNKIKFLFLYLFN